MIIENQGPTQDEAYIHIRINRNLCIATIASLLLHALLLFLLSRQELFNQQLPLVDMQQPLTVQLNPRALRQAEPAQPTDIHQPPPVTPSLQAEKPKSKPRPVPRANKPRVLPTLQADPAPMPPPPPTPEPEPPPNPAKPDPAQFSDMMAYVNAVREMQSLAGNDAGRINEEATVRERGPSPDEVRMANIQRNLQPSGTNGVFQILSLDTRTAMFAFRGWKNEYSFSRREVYEVDAGPDKDVERAVVRKMIEIIRRYYNGDFNWDSRRFDRVLVLSARLQDNDGLEDFLLQEFFETRGISAR